MTNPAREFFTPAVIPARLGWTNGQDPEVQLKLYATDKGQSPRWDGPHGRWVERAAIENGAVEGDRYLVVRLGNRFVGDETTLRVAELIEDMLDDLARDDTWGAT